MRQLRHIWMQIRMHIWIMALVLAPLSPARAADAVSPAEVQSTATPDNPLAAQPLELLSETRDRPLFSPSRRPPPPVLASVPQIVQPPAEIRPPSVVLLGVVTDDNGARAVVRAGSPEKTIRAHLGEEIDGWKVTLIEPRRLVLSHDDRSVSFALFSRPGGTGTVIQDPAPAPAEAAVQNLAQERFDRRTGRY
jgi:hypothetical protein